MSVPPTARAAIAAITAYLPRYRLTAQEIARTRRHETTSAGGRRLAGFDEDAVTLAVEAGLQLRHKVTDLRSVMLCTTTPPYAAKNNASAAHAALGLPERVAAYDCGGSLRSFLGALARAEAGTLILAGEVSTARPGAANELTHGDAGVAVLLADPGHSIAEIIDMESATTEILDQWRQPDTPWLRGSEDRFTSFRYQQLLDQVLHQLWERLDATTVDHVVVSSASERVAKAAARTLSKVAPVHQVRGVGFTGAADLPIQLCSTLATAAPDATVLAVNLSDGCDALVLRTTELLASHRPQPLRAADDAEAPAYVDALTWRGLLVREPPRRPEPNPVSPPASARGASWKYALHGAVCTACKAVSTPPQQVCVRCGATETEQVDLSGVTATVRTFSVDRLAYTPNPPLIAAVVDFDGGGRLEVEMTDCAPETVAVGQRVRMTFRRRHSSDGIHNYVWKAIPEVTR